MKIDGASLQIVDGSGTRGGPSTDAEVFIGYNENPDDQAGAHNMNPGTRQTFGSYGGLIAGQGNALRVRYSSVSGGIGNLVSGTCSSILGGSGINVTTDHGTSRPD